MGASTPQVGVDSLSNATVVWTSGGSPSRQIRSAFRPAGGPWETSFTRIPAAQDCFDPELEVNAAGAAVVLADCGAGSAQMYAAYRPAGGSWSGAVAVPGSGSGVRPRIDMDDAGNVIAVWESASNIQSAYRPAAGPWAAAGQVSPAGNVAVDPDVAVSPTTGRAVAVWLHRLERFAGDPVVTVESADRVSGTWAATPTNLSRPASTSTRPVSVAAPRIDINALGFRVAVWTEDPDNTIGDMGPIRITSGYGDGDGHGPATSTPGR